MSLDSALRQGLIAAGDQIHAHSSEGMDSVIQRVRIRRRRQVVGGSVLVAGCLAVVLALGGPSGLIDSAPSLPPARDSLDRSQDEHALPDGASDVRDVAVTVGSRPGSLELGHGQEPPAIDPPSDHRVAPQPPVERQTVGRVPDPRVVSDDYRIGRTAGTHMGENAGLGCTDGPGMTGSDDCFQIQVGAEERYLQVTFSDDAGVLVPFTIDEHLEGTSRDLGWFCGTTEDRLAVRPGALILISISGGNECGDDAPTSGTFEARFWKA